MEHSEQLSLTWEGTIAILTLSADEQTLPVLTQARLEALRELLDQLMTSSDPQPTGLVIVGAREAGFCAGADVNAIRGVADPSVGANLAAQGQEIFQRVASLPFPSIAAIHGPCVGGGFELALACTYRVALHTDDTRIGLPEIKLGILPGFGGTVRLPKLIGLPKALEIILNGKVISAVRAFNSGMVDVLVPAVEGGRAAGYDEVLKSALSVVKGEKSIRRPRWTFAEKVLSTFTLGRSLVRSKAQSGVQRETHGHYPAPLRALQVTVTGMGMSEADALAQEAQALGELIVTPECKSLVHVYFCSEAASKLGRSVREEVKNLQVGVLGAGVMGAGIAAVFLAKGHRVTVLEPIAEVRERALKTISKVISSKRGISKEQSDALIAKLTITDKMSDLHASGLVVEAIVEDIEVKKTTFRALAEVVSGDCILASNTSSLSVTEIAAGVASPERVIGMHFFNPAEKMPLVEVVRGAQTSGRCLALVSACAAALGKYPVVVDDVPGFLVNRILSGYIAESGRLLSEGVSIDAIDLAATSFGMPMGPFRMLDEVGLDVAAKVQVGMQGAYGDRMQAPEYPRILLERGRKGKKSGAGFYAYEDGNAHADPGVYDLIGMKPVVEAHISAQEVQERLVFSLIQEAVRCLDEHVAGIPGRDSAGQIDLATVMGMGFAPFRGGVLFYAETLGISKVIEKLRSLEQRYGERFKPVEGIVRREKERAGFYD